MSDSLISDPAEARLLPLCRVEARVAERLALPGTPSGDRAIVDVLALRLDGPRLRASLVGQAAADWLVLVAGGASLDVRCTVRTDDGALVFIQYNGRMRFSGDGGPHAVYVAPRFETGDARYAWLNGIQAVGKGLFDPAARTLVYRFYELA